ncbi:oxygenase MpaB family protein [Gordonia insulae]|nr:oxygenase MpaB family protein [Gordonia insulae]
MSWRVLTAPAVPLMVAQITNLLEVPHVDFQSVLLDHDPLYPTNAKRQRGWPRGAGRKGGHFHDRLRRTVSVPLPIVLGDKAAANRCATRLRKYHEPMRGVGEDGHTPYSATSADAMLFAAVTITHAALIAYESFVPRKGILPQRLSPEDRDRYFSEMSHMASLMGADPGAVPTSAQAVADYYDSISASFRFRSGWFSAQIRTATSLMWPANRHDVGATLADLILMASAVLALAVLPRPSRRLNGIPAVCDPGLRLLHLACVPGWALLRLEPVRRWAHRSFLGADDAEVVQRAAMEVDRVRVAA